VHGNPAGTVYFDRGQIAFARASWIPDLSARLLGALAPSAQSRDLLIDGDRPDRDICTLLLQHEDLTRAELQKLLRSVVVDAVLVLTMPMDADSFVAGIRFAPSGPHWASAFSRLRVDAVQAEAGRRADRLARHPLNRTAPVQLRDLGRPSALLSREQWAIACTIGRGLSAQDLAWQCGLALYEAIEGVSELIQAGMCAAYPAEGPASSAEPTGQLARWFGPAAAVPVPESAPEPIGEPADEPTWEPAGGPAWKPADEPAWEPADEPAQVQTPLEQPAAGMAAALPHRTPGTQIEQARQAMSLGFRTVGVDMPLRSDFTEAPPALLHRVLDGLRRIS
jgi:hypothetical protein